MHSAVLFDLDGTLTDSGPGIIRSVQYALMKMGIQEDDQEKLRSFVGPPLLEQFMEYAGFDRNQAQQAVTFYRERYREKGMFENEPYPGMPQLLRRLWEKGYRLAVASSKPTYFVTRILEHFSMSQYFHVIVGSELDGTRTDKHQVIEEALGQLGLAEAGQRREVVMVGDRQYDVEGAVQAGIDCIAVSYGYGPVQELRQAGADIIADSVDSLGEYLLSGYGRE